jgi:hypothetical protein
MDAINPGRLQYFPEYYTQFDSPVVWEENTCIDTVLSSKYKVQLTLDQVIIDNILGIVPHIAIWDGVQFIEQVEWIGKPYEWFDEQKSDMANIVGACANAILSEIDHQSWQYIVAISPIAMRDVPTSLLLEVIRKRKGMGINDYETSTTRYVGAAKNSAPGFVISDHHLQGIAAQYDSTFQPNLSQPNRPRWRMS